MATRVIVQKCYKHEKNHRSSEDPAIAIDGDVTAEMENNRERQVNTQADTGSAVFGEQKTWRC